jgi:DNA transformation protein
MAAKSDGFEDFVLDQLEELRDVTCRPMFGGYGLYHQAQFFGIIQKGRLYFKVSSKTLPTYQRRRMKPFRPNPSQTLKSYYEVPIHVVEDREQLAAWAEQASQIPTRQLETRRAVSFQNIRFSPHRAR